MKKGAPNAKRNQQPQRLKEANRGDQEQAAENRAKAFALRCQRKTYREIATALGVDVSTAFAYVSDHWDKLEATTNEKAEMLRRMEMETLDAMESRWLPLALHEALDVSTFKGEAHIELPAYDAGLKAVDRVIKIQERRAKLMGLDMPVKLEHSGGIQHAHLTLQEFTQRMEEARK